MKADPKNQLDKYIRYSNLGFQMLGIIAAGAFAGHWLDNYCELETPYFTAFLSLAGVVASLVIVIRDLTNKKNNQK